MPRSILASKGIVEQLFDNNPLAVCIAATTDGTINELNPRFTELTGYGRNELLGKRTSDLEMWIEQQKFDEVIQRMRKGEIVRGRELGLRRKDGSVCSVRVTASPLDFHGIPSLLIHAFDLTEQSELEERLQKSEERFSKTFHSSPAALVISRLRDGLLLDVNRATLQLYGYEREQILNKTSLELQAWPVPEERAEIIRQIKTGKPVIDFEIHIQTKAGEIRQCISAVERVELAGEECLLFLLYDITEKKKMEELLLRSNEELERRVAERTTELARANAALMKEIKERKDAEAAVRQSEYRYRSLIEQASDAIIVFDTDGIILTANSSACEMVALESEDVLGKNIAEFLDREQLLKLPIRWDDFEVNHHLITERVVVRKDGSRLETEVSTRKMSDGTMQAILRDITERKKTENERLALLTDVNRALTDLQAAEKSAEESRDQMRALAKRLQVIREEERKSIAREIHDELGQILTGLKIDLGWLENRLLTAEKPLRERVSSMTTLIDQGINSVQQISSELRPGLLDDLGLSAAIEWQASDFENRTQVICKIERLDETVGLDEDRSTALFRIFQETLTNVGRHANAHLVTINLKMEEKHVILEVHDDGIGITNEEIAGPRSIGLLGVKERALAFGGEFRIEGTPGKGTHVYVSIPV